MSEQNPPVFDTFEEMQEWLNSQNDNSDSSDSQAPTSSKKSTAKKKGSPSSPKKSSSAAKKKPASKDEANDIVSAESLDVGADNVWSTVHFYTRAGSNVASTRLDAKEEAGFRNDNVLVFYHDHIYGEACVKACGGI